MEITLEQVERLRERANVSYTQARDALEHSGGDLLEALIWLEEQGTVQPPEGGGFYTTSPQSQTKQVLHQAVHADGAEQEERPLDTDHLLGFLRDLLRRGMENELVVWRKDRVVTALPVLAAIALVIFAPWISIPLLIAGFVFGCRYRFAGPDLEREAVTRVTDVVNDAASTARQAVLDQLHRQHEKQQAKAAKQKKPQGKTKNKSD